ncbi:hypothetical protein BGX33_005413 [Mortierella sp. NVP41]|nr:hypothetical protein BGX33_005413 [Mortierella sp. NVP41]
MAQMDISSIPLTKPTRFASSSSSTVSTSSSSQPHISLQQQQQQQQPPRPRPAVKMRSSGSVTTMSSIRNTTTSPVQRENTITAPAHVIRNRTGTGGAGYVSVRKGSTSPSAVRRKEGSVTSSDDGTVSEDSVEDHPIHLFSGGGVGGGFHINNLPFGVSSTRHGPPKIASSAASSVVSASGSGARNRGFTSTSSTVSTTSNKPMRIAAGASIKVSTNSSTTTALPSATANSGTTGTTTVSSISIPSLSISASSSGNSLNGSANNTTMANGGGLLSTSLSSSTSSSSLSWVGSPSGYEPGSTSPTSSKQPITTLASQQQQSPQQILPLPLASPGSQSASQPTVRSTKSAAANVAAASKLAEENRRAEEAARTRRKIADLEISNTSLLQINQTLEATIRKQAAEMQELKMRMQSAQFGGDLSWMTSDKVLSQGQDSGLMGTVTESTSPEAAVMIHELSEAERQADLTFKRLCLSIDQMLYEGRQALDQSTKPAGMKVLSSFDMYEKEAMEDAQEDDLDAADQSIVMDEDDVDTIGSQHTEEQESTATASSITTITVAAA